MNPSTVLLMFFTFSLIFTVYASSPSPLPSPSPSVKLFQTVCKDVKENERCFKLLESYPEITSAESYLELCRYILKMAIRKATEGQNYLKEVMKKNPSSHAIQECAVDDYDHLVTLFQASLNDLVRDPMFANYLAMAAGDGAVNCNNALAQEKITSPSLSSLNNEMDFVSLVAGVATDHLYPS
ncbi:hypothetical protein RJT34_24560 [Clitoria ternatea]|uniref:Pectinesterase inhibitor domain-containing protein n=1 Tax=Clitoria ternatea TaxID=43366 RepID=A0AAN9FN39_CLITE